MKGPLFDGEDLKMADSNLSPCDLKRKEKKIRELKATLRNEEHKLVLMKKIRQSQLQAQQAHHHPVGQATSHLPTAHHHSINAHQHHPPPPPSHHNKTSTMTPNDYSNPQIPSQPPVKAHQATSKPTSRPHIVLNPPINRTVGRPPPPLGLPSAGLSAPSGHVMHPPPPSSHGSSVVRPGYSLNRTPVTTPPNVVLGYPIDNLRAQSLSHQTSANQMKPGRQSELQPSNNLSASSVPNNMNQTPAQRQQAAKLALRKQLEKTLLSIPPPKPPPPEMHFIPNANNPEFIYYHGLETIVDFLTDSPNQNKPPPEPFECVQCGTDFTPLWKWQDRVDVKRGRPAVICEQCVSSNIKKALKAEHTARLKTAFVKALEQEQEIEQRLASGCPSPPVTPSLTPPNPNAQSDRIQSINSREPLSSNHHHFANHPSVMPTPPAAHGGSSAASVHSSYRSGGHASAHAQPQPSQAASAAAAAAAAAAANSPAANAAAALAASSLLSQFPNFKNLTPAQQQLFQAQLTQFAQTFTQPPTAHMLPFAPFFYGYGAFMGAPGKNNQNLASDINRQYLLDMIPPRSLAQQNSDNR